MLIKEIMDTNVDECTEDTPLNEVYELIQQSSKNYSLIYFWTVQSTETFFLLEDVFTRISNFFDPILQTMDQCQTYNEAD